MALRAMGPCVVSLPRHSQHYGDYQNNRIPQIIVPLGNMATKLCLAAFEVQRINSMSGIATVRC